MIMTVARPYSDDTWYIYWEGLATVSYIKVSSGGLPLYFCFARSGSYIIVNIGLYGMWFWSWGRLSGTCDISTWPQNRKYHVKYHESIGGVIAIFISIYYWNFVIFRKNKNRPMFPMEKYLPLESDWSCWFLSQIFDIFFHWKVTGVVDIYMWYYI